MVMVKETLHTCGIHVFNLVADDSLTILMAFQLPEIEILGLTTIFGNVGTQDATRNALLLVLSSLLMTMFLCEIAGHPQVPVAEGSHVPLKGEEPSIADFIHGSDGLGNIFLPPPVGEKMDRNASEFLVEMVSQYPGDVSILALGPLTNLALAIKRDPCFASKVKKIVILGGAFFTAGNVNPAAEANVNEISLMIDASTEISPARDNINVLLQST
ncbi:hypothetical protein BHM03_00015422 [Ensete ventricosum]|nr:hypothetical protein BHM03_00015422 [Ensete ventricosum]